MMSLHAIRVGKYDLAPQSADLDLTELLDKSETAAPTAIYLCSDEDLPILKEQLADSFTDRGLQHNAKGLGAYLAGRTGCLYLRAKYRDPGQLRRGMNALLNNPKVPETGAHFFIGLKPVLFSKLINELDAHQEKTDNCATTVAELLKKHPKLSIPQTVKQTYVGSGRDIDVVRHLIMLSARNKHPVLIQGESGTGKEVIARLIHQMGIGVNGRFIAVNCGGIPENLLESELFGHVRGSFTGALSDKDGLWKLASEGTLFLDEIGDLAEHHQVKLLRTLEDGCFRPVGGEEEIRSSARIIAATNVNLEHLVKRGQFREDLYYRLFTIRICAPALRDHLQDLPELAQHFWKKHCDETQPVPTKKVLSLLRNHPWRGNARELRAFMLNVAALAEDTPVDENLIMAVMKERYSSGI